MMNNTYMNLSAAWAAISKKTSLTPPLCPLEKQLMFYNPKYFDISAREFTNVGVPQPPQFDRNDTLHF